MNVTMIKVVSPDLLYINTVVHECTFCEFMEDLSEEVKRFLSHAEEKKYCQIDIFWHICEYCDQKYGPCHWQQMDLRVLLPKKEAPKQVF